MAMQTCKICNSEINVEENKYIVIPEGYVHLDCWITQVFRLRNINKELFGALSTVIDYLLSSKLLLKEVIRTEDITEFKEDIFTLIKDIDNKISKLLNIIYSCVIKR